jgi:excisionase family DNA binding protein
MTEFSRRTLTVPEFAEVFHVSRSKVWQMIYSGQLPVIRIGRCVRISSESCDRLWEGACGCAGKGPTSKQ